MIRSVAPSILCSLLLAGCIGNDMSDLQTYVETVKARPPVPIEPIPEFREITPFVYLAADRRDPFTPDDETKGQPLEPGASGIAPDPARPREELEQFPLDSLRMVGTLEQYETRSGLVTAPGGTLHRVTVGNYVGQNNGQIMHIAVDHIEVSEIVADGMGHYREREATIALRE